MHKQENKKKKKNAKQRKTTCSRILINISNRTNPMYVIDSPKLR